MDELVDFEALIDINEVIRSMEKVEGEIQNMSQNSLIDALDKMCEAEDRNASCTEVSDAKVDIDIETTMDETSDSTHDVINLDEFEEIFSEMQMSVNKLEKLKQKEFSITDLNTVTSEDENTEPVNMRMSLNNLEKLDQSEFNETGLISFDDSKEKLNKPIDENDISTQTQITYVISIDDDTVDLKEFEMIFDEIRASNYKIDHEENMINTKTQNEESATSHKVTELDKIADKYQTTKNDENNTGIDNPKQNEYESVQTSELQKTLSDLIKDLDTTESDTELDNLNKTEVTDEASLETAVQSKERVIISQEDDSKTVADIKETDIIYLSSDSEDDGYNSSDFEFISESKAKKNNLTKTNIESYTYYNADYMKYHKSKYLPCRVISSKARESHVIPQGEAFLDLFRGMYAPGVMNNLYYVSKKRVLPVTSMTIQDGYGFDVYENKGEENAKYRNEANESLKKIRFLYPEENRKRRRRF